MSLYGMMRTGVSGMNAQSTRLATVADNIANSGTNGYKKASVEFSSLVVPNTGKSYVSGGVATQVRYSISQEGNHQYTTSATDLAIKGNGFFVVENGSGQPFLTRAGSFVPDGQGRLVNAAGFYLLGYNYENGVPSPVANGYAGLEKVQIGSQVMKASPTTSGLFYANLPYDSDVVPAGQLPSTNSPNAEFTAKRSLVVYDNVGQEVLLDMFFTRIAKAAPAIDLTAYGQSSTNIADGANQSFTFPGLIGEDWQNGDTFTFDMEIDGATVEMTGTFNGLTWDIAPADPAAVPAGITLSYTATAPDLVVNVANASGGPVDASFGNFVSPPATDRWEMSVFYQPNAAESTSFPYSQPALSTATLSFDNKGALIGPESLNIDLSSQNGETIELDISGMTQLAKEFTLSDVNRNGNGPSTIEQVMIGEDGNVYAQYTNGATAALFKLPLATVQSPDMLQVLPGNVFSAGLDSGEVQLGFATEGGLGSIQSGALEASNVDIAEELTNMIESQRNYTANSKVFQTGSDLMDVLVNLKR